ncbi:Rieske 2Fe-2S domain-containing protein [Alphaproteobacteria bacterium]|nr:Rieske 2Fe-2S domain-containing protein [Alphaproteobacteria bacterium]
MKNTKLCKIKDLQEKKALVIRGENKYLPGIIVYKVKASIHVWGNDCPHANLSLDLIEGKVQSKNNDLLCANHGAKFNPETGECFKGPCKNSFLKAFPFKIINDYLIAGN